MRVLSLTELEPVVRIANYHHVAPGQQWSHRILPDLQIILIVEGEFAYVEATQAAARLLPGEVLLIEPGVLHTFRYPEAKARGLISGMHLELAATGSWLLGDYCLTVTPERVTRSVDSAYLHGRFQRLAEVYRSYHPYRELQTSAIAREIVLILAGHWRQAAHPVSSPRLQAMIAFIRENLAMPLSRQDLAQAFGVTPEHINLLFRKELGMTPSAVINRERVMLAYRLIHEQGRSVKEAAYAVGYSDPFYFSRVFKRVLGVPPSQIG